MAYEDSAYDQDPDASDNQQVVADPGDQAIPTQPQQIGGADSYIGGPGKSVMAQPHRALRNTAQAIIAYLHGDGAAPPQQVKQVEQSVDPQGSMDPNKRTVAGIQAAAEQGGPDAGFSFIQAHRQQYNAKQSFARAALNGGQGKPPDLNAAVNAANQAYYHVPNGEGVTFATNGQGVTATVNGGQHFQLSPQQFDQWLDIGGQGQFDKVYEGGAAKVLGSLGQAQGQQGQGDDQQGAIQDPNDIRPMASPNVAAQNPQKYRPTPAGYKSPDVPDAGFDPQTAERSRRMAPGDLGKQTQLSMTEEARQEGNQNKIDVEKEKGNTQRDIWGTRTKSNENIAGTRADAYVKAADLKSQAGRENARARLTQVAQTAQNVKLTQAARLLSGKILSNSVTPADEVQINSILKGASQSGGAPAGGGQQSQPQPGQTRQVGSMTYVRHNDGKWYPAGQ